MNRAAQVQHLAEADRHIEEARARMARVQASISSADALGRDASSARATLGALQEVLATFLAERDSIVRTIADIDAGKYPVT